MFLLVIHKKAKDPHMLGDVTGVIKFINIMKLRGINKLKHMI